jgi:hypothetical protein
VSDKQSTIGSVAAVEGIAVGEVLSDDRPNTSGGLSPSPAPLMSPPPFLPKTTPNMTDRATTVAVTRSTRVPRRPSLEVLVVASSSKLELPVEASSSKLELPVEASSSKLELPMAALSIINF